MDQRTYTRKQLNPIHVIDIQAVDRSVVLARHGTICNASATGMLIEVHYQDLNPDILGHDLPLNTIEGDYVIMKIAEMELDMDGTVIRAHYTRPGVCEIAIDFTDNAPAYWRECLSDLLPGIDDTVQSED